MSKQTEKFSTQAEEIWNDIKDLEVSIFALPLQRVSDYCNPVLLDPSKCFLNYKVSSFLPALEDVIKKKYECELVKNYIVVSKKQD